MTLSSPNLTDYYASLEDILLAINNHADAERYAVVERRTKVSKTGVIRKANLRGSVRSTGEDTCDTLN